MHHGGAMGRELSAARQQQLLAEAEAERRAKPIIAARAAARRRGVRRVFSGVGGAIGSLFGRHEPTGQPHGYKIGR